MALTRVFHTLAIYSGAALASALVAWEVWSYWRLSHVPGPVSMGLSSYPIKELARNGRMIFELQRLQKKYGSLLRVGPNQVLFADSETYRRLSGEHSLFFKGLWCSPSAAFHDWDSLPSPANGEEHRVNGTTRTPGTTSGLDLGKQCPSEEINAFESIVDKRVSEFISLLERKYISTPAEYRPIELSPYCQSLAFDVISDVRFSDAGGFLKNDNDVCNHVVSVDDRVSRAWIQMPNMPWLRALVERWPFDMATLTEGARTRFRGLTCSARDFAATCSAACNDTTTSQTHQGSICNGKSSEACTEMIASSASTTAAIRTTILCLLTNPSALTKLRAEIDSGLALDAISTPIIRDAEARHLPYLQAIIKEGLRMYPPPCATLGSFKEVPLGGVEVNGYLLPAGTQVGVNTLAMMRDTGTFGPDAEVFNPDRWLGDGRKVEEMTAVLDLVFRCGEIECVGRTIAFMELNKVFVELFKRFDFAIENAPMTLRDTVCCVTDDFKLRATHRVRA